VRAWIEGNGGGGGGGRYSSLGFMQDFWLEGGDAHQSVPHN
jgi:hypothetical protein